MTQDPSKAGASEYTYVNQGVDQSEQTPCPVERMLAQDWRFKKTTAEHVVNQGVRHRVPLGCTMSLEWHDVAWHDERLFLYAQNCDFLVLGPLFAKWVKRKRNKNDRNRIVMLY